jgi:ankyrin repeat protein
MTALIQLMASDDRDQGILKILLEKRASVTVRDSKNETALHKACLRKRNSVESIQLLLQNGADIDSTVKDRITPLYMAIEQKNRLAVDYLISQGASLSYSDIISFDNEEASGVFEPSDIPVMINIHTKLPSELSNLVVDYLPTKRRRK